MESKQQQNQMYRPFRSRLLRMQQDPYWKTNRMTAKRSRGSTNWPSTFANTESPGALKIQAA